MARIAHVVASSSKGHAQLMRARRHEIRADESERAGGTDTGPNPTELLLSALGACTSITLRMYAERKNWNLGEIGVDLNFFKEDDGHRIEREISFSAPLDDEQRTRLAEIAEKTPVTRAIREGSRIETKIHSGSV
jgi:putative redox protein